MRDYCDLSLDEIEALSPKIRDMTPIKLDYRTTIFLKKPTTEKQIKYAIKKYNKLKNNKLWNDKNKKQDYLFR